MAKINQQIDTAPGDAAPQPGAEGHVLALERRDNRLRQRSVVPSDALQIRTKPPAWRKHVGGEPLARCARPNRGAKHLTAVRESLRYAAAGVRHGDAPQAERRVRLEIRGLALQ